MGLSLFDTRQFEGQRYDAKASFRSIADEWVASHQGKKRESITTVVQVGGYNISKWSHDKSKSDTGGEWMLVSRLCVCRHRWWCTIWTLLFALACLGAGVGCATQSLLLHFTFMPACAHALCVAHNPGSCFLQKRVRCAKCGILACRVTLRVACAASL